MIVIGLTGGIGMGKSTVARQFETLGAKTISADACVHKLMERGGAAVPLVKKHFPTVVKDGAVDRKALGQVVFADKAKLKLLEEILHPLVQQMENDFIQRMRSLGAKMVVMDIPLLFETGGETRFDLSVVVSAPSMVQQQRVMARPNMTPEKFKSIVQSQMPDLEKRQMADYIIPTGLGKAHSFNAVKTLVMDLINHEA